MPEDSERKPEISAKSRGQARHGNSLRQHCLCCSLSADEQRTVKLEYCPCARFTDKHTNKKGFSASAGLFRLVALKMMGICVSGAPDYINP